MGLDFNGSEAHWSYSGFDRFRQRLCEEIGLTWPDGLRGNDEDEKHWKAIINSKDAIVPLLNHSDCDGEISAKECGLVAPRLREIVQAWPDDDYDKMQAILLAEGMENCANKKRPLRFC